MKTVIAIMMLALLGAGCTSGTDIKKEVVSLFEADKASTTSADPLGLFTKEENQRRERDDLDDALDKVMVDTKKDDFSKKEKCSKYLKDLLKSAELESSKTGWVMKPTVCYSEKRNSCVSFTWIMKPPNDLNNGFESVSIDDVLTNENIDMVFKPEYTNLSSYEDSKKRELGCIN